MVMRYDIHDDIFQDGHPNYMLQIIVYVNGFVKMLACSHSAMSQIRIVFDFFFKPVC